MSEVRIRDTIRLYWNMTKGFHWPFVVVVLVIIIATSIGSLTLPWFYKLFFDTIVAGSVGDPETAQRLLRIILWIGLLGTVQWLVWRSSGFFSAWMYPKVEGILRDQTFTYLIRHSYRFFGNQFIGSLVRKVNRFVDAFPRIWEKIQWEIVVLVAKLAGVTIILSTRSLYLGLGLLAWTLLFMVVNYALSMWKLKYDTRRAAADSLMTGTLADILTNNLNTKLFTGYDYEAGRYRSNVTDYIKIWKWTWNVHETIMAVQTAIMIAIEISLLYIGVRLWQQGAITIGDFALLQGYVATIFRELWDFGRTIRDIYEEFANAREFSRILLTEHEVVDVPRAKRLNVTKGDIVFENVSFNYNQTRAVLGGVNLTISPGEKVALVGPSGAGKSTMTKLLLRLFDTTEGRILIDGQSIEKVTQESLWAQTSLVPQEPILFHRTIIENIRYGRRNASKKDVLHAAKLAQCHEFIKGLPEGYDTYVGERGIKLSGGERQRVAIARAILKNAPILILDEATSSLDSESELHIQRALEELMRGKTTIAIAHRLSTIMKMDRIIVMEEGRVIAEGTHTELLKSSPLYTRLWNIQAGGFIL